MATGQKTLDVGAEAPEAGAGTEAGAEAGAEAPEDGAESGSESGSEAPEGEE